MAVNSVTITGSRRMLVAQMLIYLAAVGAACPALLLLYGSDAGTLLGVAVGALLGQVFFSAYILLGARLGAAWSA
jgi:hypothetical protein